MREIIAGRSLADWVAVFNQNDVCVEPVLDLAEVFAQPQIQAREMIVQVPKPAGTMQEQVGLPFKFSKNKPAYRHIGVQPGAHANEVLAEIGYNKDEITSMRESRVLG